MVIVAGILLFAFGAMCVFEQDIAYMLYEYDARMMGKILERTRDWENLMRVQGAALILIGILGVLTGIRHF
jgi:hypothetical protein